MTVVEDLMVDWFKYYYEIHLPQVWTDIRDEIINVPDNGPWDYPNKPDSHGTYKDNS